MINAAGVNLISQSESTRLKAYLCPAGVPTIGRGHIEGITHEMVKQGYTITVEEERAMFQEDMEDWEQDVRNRLTREPNENQLAAFVSLAYNIGIFAFAGSTVHKAFERGEDEAAARAFGLWNKITDPKTKQKVVSNGLSIRRAKEAALYLTPVHQPFSGDDLEAQAMPQAVEPPKPLTDSTINRGAVVAGGTATMAMVSETANTVSGLKYAVKGLGDWLVPLLLVITIAAVGYIIWERYNQRKNGSA